MAPKQQSTKASHQVQKSQKAATPAAKLERVDQAILKQFAATITEGSFNPKLKCCACDFRSQGAHAMCQHLVKHGAHYEDMEPLRKLRQEERAAAAITPAFNHDEELKQFTLDPAGDHRYVYCTTCNCRVQKIGIRYHMQKS